MAASCLSTKDFPKGHLRRHSGYRIRVQNWQWPNLLLLTNASLAVNRHVAFESRHVQAFFAWRRARRSGDGAADLSTLSLVSAIRRDTNSLPLGFRRGMQAEVYDGGVLPEGVRVGVEVPLAGLQARSSPDHHQGVGEWVLVGQRKFDRR